MKYFIAILFTMFYISGYACNCSTSMHFCNYSESNTEESVFMIELTDSFYTYADDPRKFYDVRVIKHLFGPDLNLDTITIIETSIDCDMFIHIRTDTMILKKSIFEDEANARFLGHKFWQCKNNFLQVRNDSVRGLMETAYLPWEPDWESMPFSEFLEWFPECASTSTSLNKMLNKEIHVSPNPFVESFQINNGFERGFHFEVYNSSGQVVRSGKLESNSNIEIESTNLNSGVYYINLEGHHYKTVKKMIKL